MRPHTIHYNHNVLYTWDVPSTNFCIHTGRAQHKLLYTHGTCPAQTFGRARTNLGRGAGHADVTFLLWSTLGAINPFPLHVARTHRHVRVDHSCQIYPTLRKVDVRLPGKGNSNPHGARPVHLIITMIKWIRTSRLSIKNSLSLPRTPTQVRTVSVVSLVPVMSRRRANLAQIRQSRPDSCLGFQVKVPNIFELSPLRSAAVRHGEAERHVTTPVFGV